MSAEPEAAGGSPYREDGGHGGRSPSAVLLIRAPGRARERNRRPPPWRDALRPPATWWWMVVTLVVAAAVVALARGGWGAAAATVTWVWVVLEGVSAGRRVRVSDESPVGFDTEHTAAQVLHIDAERIRRVVGAADETRLATADVVALHLSRPVDVRGPPAPSQLDAVDPDGSHTTLLDDLPDAAEAERAARAVAEWLRVPLRSG